MKKIYKEENFFDKGMNIYTFFTYADYVRNMHSHEFWELTYVFEGEGENETADGLKKVITGDFLFIKPGAEHSITTPDMGKHGLTRICNCLIKDSFLKNIIQKYNIAELSAYSLYDMITGTMPFCIQLRDDNAGNIRHLIWLVVHEYNHYTSGSSLIIESSIAILLLSIIRIYEYREKKLTSTVSRRKDIDELTKYIRTNFGQKLTLELLAERLHFSREYLSRCFKEYTGKNISEFIAETRISHAKQMLRSLSFSIEYIGEYCGYQSPATFQKAFKKIVGVSPSEYRRKYKI